jgi:glycerophosphoryl diester phosphodiesterase
VIHPRFSKTLLVGVATVMLMTCAPAMRDGTTRQASMPDHEVMLIGHRGAAGLAPENTLTAFATALDLGVDAIELDVHLTRDSALVVYHDYTLKPETTRSADGEWLDMWAGLAIKDLTLADAKTYDVGRLDPDSFYARRYPDQVAVDGEAIPTLSEVIDLVRAHHDAVELWIEIKTSPAEPQASSRPEDVAKALVDLLQQENLIKEVKVLSFDWRALVQVQQKAPDIPTVFLTHTSARMDTIQRGTPGPSPWTAGLDIDRHAGSIPALVAAAGGRYWAPRYNQITLEDVAEAHRRGIKVFVWTPDKEEDLRHCIGLGVDGIITNRPDRLIAILGRR